MQKLDMSINTQIRSSDSSKHKLFKELHLVLPNKLIKEIEKFRINNSLTIIYSLKGNQKIHCCPKCLKAHVFKIANYMSLEKTTFQYLEILFPEEIGHEGYYLNQEELFNVQNRKD